MPAISSRDEFRPRATGLAWLGSLISVSSWSTGRDRRSGIMSLARPHRVVAPAATRIGLRSADAAGQQTVFSQPSSQICFRNGMGIRSQATWQSVHAGSLDGVAPAARNGAMLMLRATGLAWVGRFTSLSSGSTGSGSPVWGHVSRETVQNRRSRHDGNQFYTQSMQPAAPMPARHCAHAVPALPTQTTAQAASAVAQAIFLNTLQPERPTAPASGLVVAPRFTAGAWFGSLMVSSWVGMSFERSEPFTIWPLDHRLACAHREAECLA